MFKLEVNLKLRPSHVSYHDTEVAALKAYKLLIFKLGHGQVQGYFISLDKTYKTWSGGGG